MQYCIAMPMVCLLAFSGVCNITYNLKIKAVWGEIISKVQQVLELF